LIIDLTRAQEVLAAVANTRSKFSNFAHGGEDCMKATQYNTRRFLRLDLLALSGLTAVSAAAALFKFAPDLPESLAWLIAPLLWLITPLLWFTGFAILVTWAFVRILATGEEEQSKIRHWMREKLIETAGKLFAEVGFDGATIREISSRAGTNVSAVNYHFGNKLGLYTEVIKSSMYAHQADALNSSMAHPSDPRGALRTLIYEWFERMREGGRAAWLASIMAREMAQPTPALDRVAQAMGANYLRFRALIGELIGCHPDDPRTRMCVHSVVGQILHYVQSRAMLARLWPELNLDNEEQRRAIADHIVAFSLAGMESIAQQKTEPPRSKQI
jgi:AcrR family transcriptional regulator